MLDRFLDFFRHSDNRLAVFAIAVTIMFVLRAIGFSGLSLFLGVIYIMYFVSVGRR